MALSLANSGHKLISWTVVEARATKILYNQSADTEGYDIQRKVLNVFPIPIPEREREREHMTPLWIIGSIFACNIAIIASFVVVIYLMYMYKVVTI